MSAARSFRLGYSCITWGPTPDLDEMLGAIAGAGWEGVEFIGVSLDWLGTPRRLRGLLNQHGLLPVCMFGSVSLGSDAERLFGRQGVQYELPFPPVDAKHMAIEFHDFAEAILRGRQPEVDGYLGMTAVAAILGAYESALAGRAVRMEELLTGEVRAYQEGIDAALGLNGAPRSHSAYEDALTRQVRTS